MYGIARDETQLLYNIHKDVRCSLCTQVVGEEEKKASTVNVRTRDNHVHGMHTLDEVLRVLQEEKGTRSLVGLFGKNEQQGAQAENGGAA